LSATSDYLASISYRSSAPDLAGGASVLLVWGIGELLFVAGLRS
jgi:hypothetical protein